MTLQQIRYFAAAAEVLSFTEAARRLCITQPSLSYALGALGRELGAPLFEKQGRKTVLTPCGEAFLPFAQQALRTLDEGVRQVDRRLRLRDDTVNLGYFYSMGFSHLPAVLERFRREAGAGAAFCFFQAQNTHILEKLRRGELDLAFTFFGDVPQTAAVPFARQQLRLVVPQAHPLAAREEARLSELGGEAFVQLGRVSHLRELTETLFAQAGISPRTAFEAEECNAAVSFVGAGFGVAILPELPELSAYPVRALRLTDVTAERTIFLVRRTGSAIPPTADRFFEFVRQRADAEIER